MLQAFLLSFPNLLRYSITTVGKFWFKKNVFSNK